MKNQQTWDQDAWVKPVGPSRLGASPQGQVGTVRSISWHFAPLEIERFSLGCSSRRCSRDAGSLPHQR